ncbi:peptide MFS transporter [Amycolatopsis sp. PS_44_ISF1]|uniref:peptide MFS transporter n=1 Tax=Amycolatopsis sp. PS_44_ISF1 TaxID=2974917 RepID=UPI0028DEB1E9|nr:peptide MFS transporter [Amycolatopsis sp. PS_44_ISF1]MDT8910861.1 peptide MFS transporter [Amycolatopsis sp. PS_44_ISF1]
MSTSNEVQQDTRFFGHPRGLANLFGVEMWERFSFYGMQGILAIYLYYKVDQGGLAQPEATATSIVGAYGGLVYLSTIVAAWVADRVLGSERTLFFSAVLVMIGHLALALVPGLLGVGIGLVCVAVGGGGIKGNATAMVGTLYRADDSRRDGGFTLFYMGINIGALVGPLLTGLAQQEVGFHLGFGIAAVGMAIGLVQYVLGRRNLPDEARTVPNPLPRAHRPAAIGVGVLFVVVVVAAVLAGWVTAANLATVTAAVIAVASVILFAVVLSSKRITKVERRRVLSFIPMFVASAVFWSLYQQQFTVVTIYADKRLDRGLFGWTMPVSWVSSIGPVFVILLAGVFAAVWTRLGDRQPSTPIKFAAGTALMGVAFLLFLPTAGSSTQTPLLLLVLILLVFTIAELNLSPVGLSLSTKLAPRAFQTQMVALFFLSVALGSALSGSLAEYYSAEHEGAYFGVLGGIAVVVGLIIAAISPWIRKLMSGVR